MFIVLSNEIALIDEVNSIRQFLKEENHLFHLRRYDWEEEQVAEFLAQFSEEERKKLVLNHHHYLASEFGINRLHFSEQDRNEIDEEKLQRFSDAGFILSTSVHDLETFNKLPACFTYAFLSPVFDSISKSDYKAVSFDLSQKKNNIKLIALGGITIDNYNQALENGFDGGAFLGSVWNSENPMEQVNLINNYKK